MDPWVVEVLRWGYKMPFRAAPKLFKKLIHYPSYSPSSIRGKALALEVLSLVKKGAVELAPLSSPGYYSRLFVVMKASGTWRSVIDLSLLNLKVFKTSVKMKTLHSVLLRFIAIGQVYQFKDLCFGLFTAPQVFTRVMAPVSAFLHCAGIRIRRYLDDWLIQAASRSQVMCLDAVLHL